MKFLEREKEFNSDRILFLSSKKQNKKDRAYNISTRNQCWKVPEHHMVMSQGADLNQFQTVKDATKVNSPQRLYKHICATNESEAWRECQ